jgi:hypothetical protein
MAVIRDTKAPADPFVHPQLPAMQNEGSPLSASGRKLAGDHQHVRHAVKPSSEFCMSAQTPVIRRPLGERVKSTEAA